jgi:predicted lipoprotein with Yx(FWY)xxD motif
MSAAIRRLFAAAALAAAAAAGVLAAAARGATTLTLRSVHSSSLGHNVVATPSGRTLYHRTRETTTHFLCTRSCATIWPPLTVASRSVRLVKGSGVHGRLGLVRRPRPDGRLQVTLNGLPLYRFSGDHRTGDAKGEGIPGEGSGGGVWHAVLASAPTTSPPPTSPPPTTTYPGY